MFGGSELLAYDSCCRKTTKLNPKLENLRKLRVPFFVNKHSTDTRCRASSVTMHDGEQITAIQNQKLAQHQKQNSLTDKSECKFLKSTGFESCTALKWSTKNWTSAGFDADNFCRYRMLSRGNGESKSKSFQCNTLGWPQFERFLKHFDPSGKVEVMEIPIAICDSCLANNAAFSELRSHDGRLKTRYLWERIVSFSTLRLSVLFWRTEKIIYESLKIFCSKTKFSWKSFHQSQKWPEIILLNYKTSLVNVLYWVTSFIFAIQ